MTSNMSTIETNNMEVKITTSIMQKNWTLLKQINVNDVLDHMIEKSLISLDASRGILKRETERQQANDLLYLVFSKQQSYLDAFIEILAENGYDFIVQKLEDAAKEAVWNASERRKEERRPKTSGDSLRKADSLETGRSNREKTNVDQSLAEEMYKQQMQEMQKQYEMLKIHQSEEMAKQTEILKEHNESIIRKEFSKMREHDSVQKELETRIIKLEQEVKSLQMKLDQERAKFKKDSKNSNDKIQELQRQKEELKSELNNAKKEHADACRRLKQENLYLRNQLRHSKVTNERSQNLPGKTKNPFTSPLNPNLAKKMEDIRKRQK